MSLILIVDDEEPVRDILAILFRDAGHQVVQAIHGGHALSLIARQRPDLVISDIMMPMVGGVELCRRLKSDPATSAIPVILMSSAGRRAAAESGADAFVDKPFDLDTIEAIADNWLAKAKSE